ncbi:hypothetical protein HWV62_15335 [Athelia sp. TMB]|nr:hypothetical protein HWV62_15335 [Athelia sp. TMB]
MALPKWLLVHPTNQTTRKSKKTATMLFRHSPPSTTRPTSFLRDFITPPRAPRFNTFAFEAYPTPEAAPFADDDTGFAFEGEGAMPAAPRPNAFQFDGGVFQADTASSASTSTPNTKTPSPSASTSTPIQSPAQRRVAAWLDSSGDMESLVADTTGDEHESYYLPSTPPVLAARLAGLGLGFAFGPGVFGVRGGAGEDLDEDDADVVDVAVAVCKPRRVEQHEDGIHLAHSHSSESTLLPAQHSPSAKHARAPSASCSPSPRRLTRNLSLATISSALKCVPRRAVGVGRGEGRAWKA